ncbi:MAG: GIY-YIG nuclease family protein [Candidatus Absconditabacterales bacterium]
MSKQGYVYIMTNKRNGALYIGVTSDLMKRVYEHKNKLTPGFTSQYGLDKLVYYEECGSIEAGILREKQLKGGNRKNKLKLIEDINPEWSDLSEERE